MIIREGHEIDAAAPLPLAGGVGGGPALLTDEAIEGYVIPSPDPSRKRKGSSSVDLVAFADDHFLGRTTIVEVRTGTAMRGSSMLPGIGALGIGGAAPM